MSFTCPDCGRTSQHPDDASNAYCANCHEFKNDDPDEEDADGPWRDGRLRVLAEKCSTCIFRWGNLMHLAPGQLDKLVDKCLTGDTFIVCHQTIDGPRSICRGFYDGYSSQTKALRIADVLGLTAYDEPPPEH